MSQDSLGGYLPEIVELHREPSGYDWDKARAL